MEQQEPRQQLRLSDLLDDGLRDLVNLISGTSITELSIDHGETRIHIRNAAVNTAALDVPAVPVAGSPSLPPAEVPAAAPSGTPVTSPIVGTYYSAPNPGADPFVRPGDFVLPGQTVAIVEAMKIMNQIESEVAGKVLDVLVTDGQAVEFGQTLMLIDTTARPGS